uniref:Uncharacterized protein n=1 Tax=Amphilophus citrinellus TaxID=61819 RepID=A0A3Q0T6S5_AMPCI
CVSVTAAAIAAGAGGAVVSAPIVLGAVGFTSVGIAASSYAASMMSAAAVANGGGVAAGSLVAILQSAGMAGLSGTATAVVGNHSGNHEGKKKKNEGYIYCCQVETFAKSFGFMLQ